MELAEAVQKVKGSDAYKQWEHKGFLAHAFVMLEDTAFNSWQLGFYENDKVTTFVLKDNAITIVPAADILKSNREIQELSLDKVKLTAQQALDKAKEVRQDKYPVDLSMRTFMIIQVLEHGMVYNITFLTKTLKTVNVKVSTLDGSVKHHSCEPLVSMQK